VAALKLENEQLRLLTEPALEKEVAALKEQVAALKLENENLLLLTEPFVEQQLEQLDVLGKRSREEDMEHEEAVRKLQAIMDDAEPLYDIDMVELAAMLDQTVEEAYDVLPPDAQDDVSKYVRF
jgi:hypothetical protein